MKIIFLDIDGVLNVIGQGYDKYGQLFHEHFQENLRYIIKKTGAKIVITSSWRGNGLEFLQNLWKDRNIGGEIIGITDLDYDKYSCRGEEIDQYIKTHNVEKYVIIDDDSDMLEHQMKNFVCTSDNIDHEDCVDIGYGLTKICAEKAIEILNN